MGHPSNGSVNLVYIPQSPPLHVDQYIARIVAFHKNALADESNSNFGGERSVYLIDPSRIFRYVAD